MGSGLPRSCRSWKRELGAGSRSHIPAQGRSMAGSTAPSCSWTTNQEGNFRDTGKDFKQLPKHNEDFHNRALVSSTGPKQETNHLKGANNHVCIEMLNNDDIEDEDGQVVIKIIHITQKRQGEGFH